MSRSRDGLWGVLLCVVLAAGVHAGGIGWNDDDDGIVRLQWTTLLSSFSVEAEGDIEFTDDDRGVAAIAPGGYLEIAERSGFVTRELRIEPTRDGKLDYRYRRGSRTDFDEDARSWFAGVLPRVIRESGVGAQGRVARILRTNDVQGVLNEIDRIDSGSAVRIYCLELLAQADLDKAQLERLARAAVSGIESSGDRSSFLMKAAEHYLERTDAADAYFKATATIPSSGDHAAVLLNVLDGGLANDPAKLAAVLRSARGIASSGDRALVLASASRAYVEDERVRDQFFDTANSIPSSGDHALVLHELLRRPALSSATLAGLFDSARGIASSGDRSGVLIAGADRYDGDAAVRRAYFRAADSIPSSGDHSQVLIALLEADHLDPSDLIALLESARGISSSGDKARVLLRAADRVTDDHVVDAYLSAARTIASSGDKDQVLSALTR